MTSAAQPVAAIELEGVTKVFRRGKVAVRNLSLRIPAGTTFGFIGPNGAGKTTTIKMLMGMLRMSAGRTRVLGIDVGADPVELKRRVGYVPEQHFIYRSMRVQQVIGFCRALHTTWNDGLCADLVRRFELDERCKVKHLSKGSLAKLSLLLALAHEPEVLILDEPMAGLDPLMREEFLDGVVGSICDRPRTVLFSSHMLGDVQRLADAVGIIDQGELIVQGRTEDVIGGTKRIRAVLRDGATPERPPEGTIWQRVQQREWLLTVRGFTPETVELLRSRYPVEGVEVVDLGLEDIFKDYVRGRRVMA